MKKQATSNQLTEIIVEGIQEVKGKDISIIDMQGVDNAICDFFVLCSGDSHTQVESIAKSIEKETRKTLKEKPWHTEGERNAEWVLLDYINVVVHVFHKEVRTFYNLEELWADAPIKEVPNIA